MYNRMYWNDIVQLIFSYTYITFCFVQCFLFYTTYKMVLQCAYCDSTAGVLLSLTLPVSCLHKNVKFHRINNTYMLHPRLKCPLRASCLWVLASKKHGIAYQVCVSVFKRNHKAKKRFLFVSELMTLQASSVLSCGGAERDLFPSSGNKGLFSSLLGVVITETTQNKLASPGGLPVQRACIV